jgi:hypothetical protein
LQQLEIGITHQSFQVVNPPGGQVVDPNDGIAKFGQSLNKIRAKESCGTSYDGSFHGHSRIVKIHITGLSDPAS